MEELDLNSSAIVRAKFGGQTYDLREPTTTEVIEYQKMHKKSEGNELELVLSFLAKMGLPIEVGSSIGISKLDALTRLLIGSVKKNRTK